MVYIINKATEEDVPVLAEILCAVYMREPISQFALRTWPDEENALAFYTTRMHDHTQNGSTDIFKISNASNHILGCICLNLEPAKRAPRKSIQEEVPAQSDLSPDSDIHQRIPPFFNSEFVQESADQAKKLKNLMKDEKYYYLSTFAVRPAEQRQGIGSQLLRYCLDSLDDASLRTWLIAYPGSHSLYLKFGFKDVEHVDTDLNAWDEGRLRGFGIWRQYVMVREPRGK